MSGSQVVYAAITRSECGDAPHDPVSNPDRACADCSWGPHGATHNINQEGFQLVFSWYSQLYCTVVAPCGLFYFILCFVMFGLWGKITWRTYLKKKVTLISLKYQQSLNTTWALSVYSKSKIKITLPLCYSYIYHCRNSNHCVMQCSTET